MKKAAASAFLFITLCCSESLAAESCQLLEGNLTTTLPDGPLASARMVLNNVCDAESCTVTVTLGEEILYQSAADIGKPIRFCQDASLLTERGDGPCDVALYQAVWRFRFLKVMDYIEAFYSEQGDYVASDCLSSDAGDMPMVPNERPYRADVHFFANFRVETNIERRGSN